VHILMLCISRYEYGYEYLKILGILRASSHAKTVKIAAFKEKIFSDSADRYRYFC